MTFRMHPDAYEVHTATSGPGNPETEPNCYLGQIAGELRNAPVFALAGRLPERAAPAGPATLTPALHGNGFWNSGVLDIDAATPLPPVERGDVRARPARTTSTA